jgi:hypothetical protein
VTDVMQIPGTEAGTEGEGQVLPPWCDQHQFRSIVFVAARDHSRRWRRVLNRVMRGRPTRVMVQPARYSILTQTDGGKLATASGQKSSNSRSSCWKSFCTHCHFDIGGGAEPSVRGSVTSAPLLLTPSGEYEPRQAWIFADACACCAGLPGLFNAWRFVAPNDGSKSGGNIFR